MTTETYPYPLRPSEFVKNGDWLKDVHPLNLDSNDRSKIQEFEGELFSRLKPLRDISISTHVIYLDYFQTDEGKRLFSAIYLDPNIKEKVVEGDEDAFFERLIEKCKTEREFEEYRNGKFARPGDLSVDAVKSLFYEANIANIPKKIREKVNSISSNYAQSKLKEEFERENGNIRRVENPERIGRVVYPDKIEAKLVGLRQLKSDIKKMKDGVDGTNDYSKAQVLVLDLYQKYINVLIASEAGDERLLPGGSRRFGSRAMERIDHFLAGVGLATRKDKLFATIPLRLARYAGLRMRRLGADETAEYKKYNSYKIDSEDLSRIINFTLSAYGLNKGEKSWSVSVDKARKTLSISGGKKTINIPAVFDRGLVDTLGVVAHEIEGHVVRFVNQENSMLGNLKIVEELSTGRTGILSEGSSMRIEDETVKQISGNDRPANPYYYLAIARKEQGGSFRACLKEMFEARAKKVYGKNLKEAIADPEIFKENFGYAYTRTMRIFGRNTPFNDTSGFTPVSDQLEYIEQELVLDVLLSEEGKKKGIDKILYVAGIDLYSLEDLIRLGILDLSKVQNPKKAVANEIWPKIKKYLDSGQNIKQAIEAIQSA